MFATKPTFAHTEIQIDLPTCMYKMKRTNEFDAIETHLSDARLTNALNGNGSAAVSLLTTKSLPDVSQQIETFLKTSNGNDLHALQQRQTAIIKQLEQLRLKLNDMQTKLGVSDIKSVTVNKTAVQKQQKQRTEPVARPIDVKHLKDLVIHVNPANIPYSLRNLQLLWSDRLHLVIECYTHSSVPELPLENRAFMDTLNVFKQTPSPTVPSLNVSLIWKQTATTDLVCAPGTFIPITGEPNILRYLIRIGPSEFGYGNSIQANLEIDAIFDLTYELILATARDHRLAILKRLSQRLNTQKAFGGDSTNVSDSAVFSALRQLHVRDKELPANLKAWFTLMDQQAIEQLKKRFID